MADDLTLTTSPIPQTVRPVLPAHPFPQAEFGKEIASAGSEEEFRETIATITEVNCSIAG